MASFFFVRHKRKIQNNISMFVECKLKKIINNTAIQITGYKVLPGREIDIAKEINEILGEKHNYTILKGFGAFDIVLCLEIKSFEENFPIGHIDGVLKTMHFPCFVYDDDSGSLLKKLRKDISTNVFTGISLLKLNPNIDSSTHRIQNKLAPELLKQKNALNKYVLGTVGWHELVLFGCTNDLDLLIEELFWSTEQSGTPLVSKSLSFVSLNYRELLKVQDNLSDCEDVLNEIKSLKGHIKKSLYPVIFISAEPVFCHELGQYWEKDKFSVVDSLGEEDLIIIPRKNKNVTWSYFLSTLMHFRKEYKDKILYTKIRINRTHEGDDQKKADQIFKKRGFNPDLDEYKSPQTEKLQKSINGLIEMLDNRVSGRAFDDMIPYARFLTDYGKESKNLISEERVVTQASEIIKYGKELRLYGTYGVTEDATVKISFLRGGIQQILLAMEAIPHRVAVKRLNAKWDGFIIASDYKFSTITEIINVPFDVLFKPQRWWALYHEFAHLFIHTAKPRVVDKNSEALKIFLSDKTHPNWWVIFANEVAAEIIGFEIGFFEDFDLFLKLVWSYLAKIYDKNDTDRLEQYMIRTFFVELFFRLYIKQDSTLDELDNIDDIYVLLLAHIEKIEKIISHSFGNNKYFIAAKSVQNIKGFLPFLAHVRGCIKNHFTLPSKSELDLENTDKAVKAIKNGMVFAEGISNVEAVLYKFFAENELSLNQEIALILSLCVEGDEIGLRGIN